MCADCHDNHKCRCSTNVTLQNKIRIRAASDKIKDIEDIKDIERDKLLYLIT